MIAVPVINVLSLGSKFTFIAYSTKVYLGPFYIFPFPAVGVRFVRREFREALLEEEVFPSWFPRTPLVSPGPDSCSTHGCPAAEAQAASPVPGGQQLSLAPATRLRTHAHTHMRTHT